MDQVTGSGHPASGFRTETGLAAENTPRRGRQLALKQAPRLFLERYPAKRLKGFEPSTFCMARSSSQLSYSRKRWPSIAVAAGASQMPRIFPILTARTGPYREV